MTLSQPIKTMLRNASPDDAAIETLWRGVRRKDRFRRRRPAVVALAILSAAAVGTALRSTAVGVLVASAREVRVAIVGPSQCGASTRVTPSPNFRGWLVGPAGVEVTDGTLLVAGESLCSARLAEFSVEVASARVRMTSYRGAGIIVVESGTIVVRDAKGNQRVVGLGEIVGDAHAWRDLARAGGLDEAYWMLGHAGILGAAEAASPDDLALLAAVAHAGHENDVAVLLLLRVVNSARASPAERGLAAYELGTRHLEDHQAVAAAHDFRLALRFELPPQLRADAARRAKR